MGEWFEDLSSLTEAVPIEARHLEAWPDQVFTTSVSDLEWLPIADSELLLASHHLPLTVRRAPVGWEVVADLKNPNLRRPIFSAKGEWLPGYKPLALRLLPFATSSSGQILRLGEDVEDEPQPRKRAQMETVHKHLTALYTGRRRLAGKVERLVSLGWLRSSESDQRNILVPTQSDLNKISVSIEHFEALELLMVLAFSHKALVTTSPLRALTLQQPMVAMPDRDIRAPLPDFLDFDDGVQFDKL